jgi:iron complex transport system ATP-binding protein
VATRRALYPLVTAYSAGKRLCEDLNVTLRAGESWAILGANGSAKTTLLHTLAGLRPAPPGAVSLAGRPLEAYKPRERAKRMAVLLQDHEAGFAGTVMDAVLIGRHPHVPPLAWETEADYAAARAALVAVDLADFGARLLSTLSGGEQRRVAIAALLAQATPIRLLDEPTNHLDLRHQIGVLSLLTAGTGAQLNVFVLHDINLAARFCSHGLLLLGDGAHACGPLERLLNTALLGRLYGCDIDRVQPPSGPAFLPARPSPAHD